MPELGLFPLSIVLVPTERIPLHIFEPRYRELIEECVENETDFGLVLATGDGAVHEIGTRASVLEVLEVLDDGRMNVVVEGGERFRLLELTSGRSPRPRRATSTCRRPTARSSTSSSQPGSTSASTRSKRCSR
jgi:Lon protease-like protein